MRKYKKCCLALASCACVFLLLSAHVVGARGLDQARLLSGSQLPVTPEKYFSFDSETGVIVDYDAVYGPSDVVIPSEINGVSVKVIGGLAFSYNPYLNEKKLRSVVIPDSVTIIVDWAFMGNQLTELVLPDSVTSIGMLAFWQNQLESVTLSNQLKTIGDGAFMDNNLTEIVIPDSVTYVGSDAFSGNLLEAVTLPNQIKYIHDGAFHNNNLVEIDIPDTIIEIGTSAFSKNQLTSVRLPDGLEKISHYAFGYNNLTKLVIPERVAFIGWGAFAHNPNLSDVSLSKALITIRPKAFESCGLVSIEIPKQVEEIGEKAFLNNQLTSITIMASDVVIGDHLLTEDNDAANSFRAAYEAGGPGVYKGTQDGIWRKDRHIETGLPIDKDKGQEKIMTRIEKWRFNENKLVNVGMIVTITILLELVVCVPVAILLSRKKHQNQRDA